VSKMQLSRRSAVIFFVLSVSLILFLTAIFFTPRADSRETCGIRYSVFDHTRRIIPLTSIEFRERTCRRTSGVITRDLRWFRINFPYIRGQCLVMPHLNYRVRVWHNHRKRILNFTGSMSCHERENFVWLAPLKSFKTPVRYAVRIGVDNRAPLENDVEVMKGRL
jgi:hypothetical protein